MDFRWYAEMAKTAERGKIDTLFFQDTAAVAGSAGLTGSRYRPGQGRNVYLEPATVLAALATVTTHIGLTATATTTYNEPYNVARRFLTIDHISGGRAGWNLVTSQIEDEAGNYGLDKHVEHGLRYERATEFYEVVTGLWDSWEDDALLYDKEAGRYFDTEKLHFLNHVGKHFRVRGPLNMARSPQGRPVISEAGSSEPGRELAALSADIVFTAQTGLDDARDFYVDVKRRAARYGRGWDDIKILPGFMPIVGRTPDEARAKFDRLQALLTDETSLPGLARLTGDLNLYDYPLDGPLPDLPQSNAAQARQKMMVELARRENLSIRQLARYLAAAQGHRLVYGTPAYIADQMQEWLDAEVCDGFNLLLPYFPGPLVDFVGLVVPELQRRGIYRTEYEGRTLRENLGVPVPPNRFTRPAS